MNEVKIPFARSPMGHMISVDAVARGLACECFCPSCDAPLVARKGEKNQHHFAHYVESENCADARETALHKFAKQVICEVPFSFGPSTLLCLPDNLNLGMMRDASMEQWLDGIRPDVLAQYDEPVAIEVRVAHPIPTEKIQKLIARKLATFEIDLSAYRNLDTSEDHWRQVVLRTAHRFWLVQPAIVREEIERKAREAAERAAQEARRAKELSEYREAQERQEKEWQALVTKDFIRRQNEREKLREERERAEKEYEHYRAKLKEQEKWIADLRLLEGLKLCADTKRHLEEWERRKLSLR
jgi:hypothetical protein